jgi:hypothetical protein
LRSACGGDEQAMNNPAMSCSNSFGHSKVVRFSQNCDGKGATAVVPKPGAGVWLTPLLSWKNATEETIMRGTFIAMALALGVGLAGTSPTLAGPANGVVIGDAANMADPVVQVQHWRWASGGHWRWRSRGRCHVRVWSGWRC